MVLEIMQQKLARLMDACEKSARGLLVKEALPTSVLHAHSEFCTKQVNSPFEPELSRLRCLAGWDSYV